MSSILPTIRKVLYRFLLTVRSVIHFLCEDTENLMSYDFPAALNPMITLSLIHQKGLFFKYLEDTVIEV